MKQDRKFHILRHIIEQFIHSAHPVSSGSFLELDEFSVSSATIRNEMGKLEKEGYIVQPHTSAGRVPTSKGYDIFVKELMDVTDKDKKNIFGQFQNAQKKHFLAQAREKVYDGISILSQLTDNVAFATIPENKRTLFLGIANLLKQPEFVHDNSSATGVIEVLEQGFFDAIEHLDIQEEIDIHIGENDIFPNIQSCSLMCTKYNHNGFTGILGVVGPMRMDYARNKLLIEYTKLFIEGQKLLK
ncbi:hypothetical protein HON22_01945 [Candidatus Peregrinibacteria bacterium]|nr:hypothetical protein [Candidatus Peregrinibacteria bacterium]